MFQSHFKINFFLQMKFPKIKFKFCSGFMKKTCIFFFVWVFQVCPDYFQILKWQEHEKNHFVYVISLFDTELIAGCTTVNTTWYSRKMIVLTTKIFQKKCCNKTRIWLYLIFKRQIDHKHFFKFLHEQMAQEHSNVRKIKGILWYSRLHWVTWSIQHLWSL